MNYSIIAPNHINEKKILTAKTLSPFSEVVLDFIDAVSTRIINDTSLDKYPELKAMAFWMRKKHIKKLKIEFESKKNDRICVPRGIAFHITPSNVDTIFVYSWFISMMLGNINIIRLSNNENEQLIILINILKGLLEKNEFETIKNRVLLIRYPHDDAITRYFSSLCDMRIIWGGDETIHKIRLIPLKSTGIDITFGDKFSFSIINASYFLALNEKINCIDSFYNDAFWFSQMACSSPKLIIWVGNHETTRQAKKIFWQLLEQLVIEKNKEFVSVSAINKHVAAYALAIQHPVKIQETKTNLIHRILLNHYSEINEELHCGAGLFYELNIKELNEIAPFILRKHQTASILGFNKHEIKEFVLNNSVSGIDRFVPIGKALEFSQVWDGIDLFTSLTRVIDVSMINIC